jgi:hypothetical protein
MGEANCHNSRRAAYRQEVRRLEEKFDGFELHHVLRQDNKAVNALAQLRSNCEPPHPGVFMQDLFKPSIRLEEDTTACPPRGSPIEASSPEEDGPVPISEASPGASAGPITPSLGPKGEVAAIVGLASPEVGW